MSWRSLHRSSQDCGCKLAPQPPTGTCSGTLGGLDNVASSTHAVAVAGAYNEAASASTSVSCGSYSQASGQHNSVLGRTSQEVSST